MGPLDVFLRVSFAGFSAILATVSVESYVYEHRGEDDGQEAIMHLRSTTLSTYPPSA